jgi:hypothetical protein
VRQKEGSLAGFREFPPLLVFSFEVLACQAYLPKPGPGRDRIGVWSGLLTVWKRLARNNCTPSGR